MESRISIIFPLVFAAFLAVSSARMAGFAVLRAFGHASGTPSAASPAGPAGDAGSDALPDRPAPAGAPSPAARPAEGAENASIGLPGRAAHFAGRIKAKLGEFAAHAPPFRNALAHFDARWTYRLSGLVRSRQVALAENGWLFYLTRQDGDTIEDYRGEKRFPPYEAELLRERLVQLRDYLAGRGIAFAFVVVPNKENVYPEFVPPRFRRISDVSRADALLAGLRRTTDLPVADPKPALLAHKPVRLVYYEYDSHWNRAGAYIGAQTVLAALGRPAMPIDGQSVLPAGAPDFAADVAGLVGIPSIAARTSTEFTVEGFPILRPERSDWKSLGTVENPDSRTPDALLILGDSFKNELAPPFLAEFRRVSDVHWDHSPGFPALIDELQPDAVVLEFVERYLPFAAKTVSRLLPPGLQPGPNQANQLPPCP